VNVIQHTLVFLVRVYQKVLSPAKMALFGPLGECRYQPCCSEYAAEAVRVHGAIKGSALAAWRICRCNPWGRFGADPVPPKAGAKTVSYSQAANHCVCGKPHASPAVAGPQA
jgi:putative membrane protein insertion efficiency factor